MEVITMSYLYNENKSFALGLILAVCVIMVLGFSQTASAQGRGDRHGRGSGHQQYRDARYQHNHSYPARGQFIGSLPRGHREVFYHNTRYHFQGGVWYRPEGRRFLVVAPPIGLFIPFLPPFYSTVWHAGIPYYYANEVYYTPTVGGYAVVEPPQGEVSQTQPSNAQTQTGQIFIYPRQGQSQQKQSDDRYACHSWAVDQTSYDPTKPPAGASETQMIQQNENYRRAMSACLDGRGYTVK
jgi:hypothetical protein